MALFILVDHDPEEQTSTFTYSNIITELFFRVICSYQLIMTIWYLYLWLKLRMPLALSKFDEEEKQRKEDAEVTVEAPE